MKKIKAWVRKHKKGIIIADAAMIVVVCALLAFISTPVEVEGLQVSGSTYSTAQLSWDKAGNTAAYRVYRSEDGQDYEYLDSTADTTFTDKKLHTGNTYYYKIVARNGLRTSDIDETEAVEVVPSLDAPKLDVDTTQGEMKLSFTPVEGAAGYEIFRDGESIGQTEGTEFKDEQAEAQGGEFNYEVKAYRYKKDPVYSAASNKVGAEMYAITGFNVATTDQDLMVSWNGNDHYSTYRIYSGDEIIGETSESKFRITGFDLDTIYKLKLVAFTSDGSEQSPDISKQFKVFEEERELTVVLLVDISRSGLFGTQVRTKRDLIAEIAAVLSFSAILNNDKVGALLFSDRVEKFIPPKKGRSHLLHILREILEYEPQSDGTDIGEALRYLTGAIKKKCTAFVLSDMLDVDPAGTPRYEDALKVAVSRHDLSVIKVHDPRERSLPPVGLVHVKDAETGQARWINTSSRRTRTAYADWFTSADRQMEKLLLRHHVDSIDVATDGDYVRALMGLFEKR